MFQVLHRCPYCADVADFAVSQLSEIVQKPPVEGAKPFSHPPFMAPRDHNPFQDIPLEGCGLSRCPHCGGPVLLILQTTRQILNYALQSLNKEQPEYRIRQNDHFRVVASYPEVALIEPNPYWPNEIKKIFVDIQNMLAERKSTALIVSGARSVLDVATKKLDPKLENKPLAARIDMLASDGLVVGSVKAWAHEVRALGNNAVHDLHEYTQDEAVELVDFIKLFLHVAFELPGVITEKKTKAAAAT